MCAPPYYWTNISDFIIIALTILNIKYVRVYILVISENAPYNNRCNSCQLNINMEIILIYYTQWPRPSSIQVTQSLPLHISLHFVVSSWIPLPMPEQRCWCCYCCLHLMFAWPRCFCMHRNSSECMCVCDSISHAIVINLYFPFACWSIGLWLSTLNLSLSLVPHSVVHLATAHHWCSIAKCTLHIESNQFHIWTFHSARHFN